MLKEQIARVEIQEALLKEQIARVEIQEALLKEQIARVDIQEAMLKEQTARTERQELILMEQSAKTEQLEIMVKQQNARADQQDIILKQQSTRTEQQETLLKQQTVRSEHQATLLKEQTVRIDQQANLLMQQTAKTDRQETMLKQQTARTEQHETLLKQQAERLENHEDRIRQQEAEIATLKKITVVNCPAQKPIAFMAQLSQHLNQPANGHVVVFDDVITNQGSAYNNVHGIFTAPVNGTYTFNLVVSSPNDASASHSTRFHLDAELASATFQKFLDKRQEAAVYIIHVLLKLNTKTVGYVFLDGNTVYWLRRTTSIVVNMRTGDELWAEVDGVTGTHALGGCCFHTHLNGFLI